MTGARISALCLALSTAACAVGPNYRRPSAPAPPLYKELSPAEAAAAAGKEWKPAEPRDETRKGKWWELFGDPQLNALEEQVA